MIGTKQLSGTIDFSILFFSIMEVSGAKELFGSNRSSKYLHLCSAEERNSYKFETTCSRQKLVCNNMRVIRE